MYSGTSLDTTAITIAAAAYIPALTDLELKSIHQKRQPRVFILTRRYERLSSTLLTYPEQNGRARHSGQGKYKCVT